MKVTVTVNGRKIQEEVACDLLLIDFLRSHGCPSVKRGCETSNCGLCTVLMDAKPENSEGVISVRALADLVFGVKSIEELRKEEGVSMSDRMAGELEKLLPLSEIYLNEMV